MKGLLTVYDIPKKLSPESLDVLLHLASEPGLTLSRERIIRQVWGEGHGGDEDLDRALDELLQALEENSDSPRLIGVEPGNGLRLLADIEVMNFNGNDTPHEDLQTDLPLREIQPDPDGTNPNLWEELKQRKIVTVGIGYLAFAAASLEVVANLREGDVISITGMKIFALALAVGFVISLILTWLFQVTPEGIVVDTRPEQSRQGRVRQFIELGVIMILLVAVSILVYRVIDDPSPPTGTVLADNAGENSGNLLIPQPVPMPEYENSIAVLPFVNLGENEADTYVGWGLAEELTHSLTLIKGLKVAARTSAFSLADGTVAIPTIARKLGVKTVLEGSFRREGEKLRVTAQLIDADGFHLWSSVYDREFGNILEMQSHIAISVARSIIGNVSTEAITWLREPQTDNIEAFDAYLQGLEQLRKPRHPESLEAADEWFELALELDPRYARAWAAACETQLSWFRLNRDVAHFEQAEKKCNRALTLDSQAPEVYTALGNLYRTSSQFQDAKQYFEQALEINPYSESTTYGLARSLQGLGDLREAERLLRYGIELEPGYWGPYMGLGNFLFRMGRYEQAAEQYLKVTELTPDNPDGFTNLGAALFDAMEWEGAKEAWQVSLELKPTPMGYRNMGTVYYYQGRYEEAVAMHSEAVALAPHDHWLWGKLAAAYREIEGQEENCRAAYLKAIELATKRLEIETEDGPTMAYLAAYLVSVGEVDEAIRNAERAKSLEPENPEIWYFSALVHTRIDEPLQAVEDISRAVDLGYSTRQLAADPQLTGLSELEEFQRLIQ